MHVLLVADGRSPITLRWLDGLLALGHQVTLISSHPCQPPAGIKAMHVLPIAFSRFSGQGTSGAARRVSPIRSLVRFFRKPLLELRYRLSPLSLSYYAPRYRQLVLQIKPDLVHALRIPYEGMLARHTPAEFPLILSTWGNDLTLHAPHSKVISSLTRQALSRADGLHTDTRRDLRLAREWGFPENRPTLVAPGSGGIDFNQVHQWRTALPVEIEARIPKGHTLVINPRGLRAYTRTDTFFRAIPLILEKEPDIAFLCPSMLGEAEAERWCSVIQADQRVVLLPNLSQGQLWELFARCPVSLSITNHDGTPNTLLEAMALGSFPIAGDIESLREWIIPGENGLLVDPDSPEKLAEAVIWSFKDHGLRVRANQYNLDIVCKRAEISQVRPAIEAFYKTVTSLG